MKQGSELNRNNVLRHSEIPGVTNNTNGTLEQKKATSWILVGKTYTCIVAFAKAFYLTKQFMYFAVFLLKHMLGYSLELPDKRILLSTSNTCFGGGTFCISALKCVVSYHNYLGKATTQCPYYSEYVLSDMCTQQIRPWGYKTFFMLNSTMHEIFSAHKYENASNCWHFHIY